MSANLGLGHNYNVRQNTDAKVGWQEDIRIKSSNQLMKDQWSLNACGKKASNFVPYQFVLAFRMRPLGSTRMWGRRLILWQRQGKKNPQWPKWSQETNWTGDQRVVKAVKGSVPDSEDSF